MAKGNTPKKNAPREDSAPAKAKPASKKASAQASSRFSWITSKRSQRITGLALLLFSLYCTIAFTSYLFTWKSDQSKLYGSWWDFFWDGSVHVENWLGKIGAMLSHLFMHNAFGLASYLFVILFFVYGIRLVFKTSLIPLGSSTLRIFFLIAFISLSLGFIFQSDNYRIAGGLFGYQLQMWLVAALGTVGTGALLASILVGYGVVAHPEVLSRLSSQVKLWWANVQIQRAERALQKEKEAQTFHNTIAEQDNFSDALQSDNDPNTEAQPPVVKPDHEKEADKEELWVVDHRKDDDLPEDDGFDLADLTDDEDLPPRLAAMAEDGQLLDEDAADATSFEVEQAVPEQELSQGELNSRVQEFGEYDPTLDLSSYKMPPIDLLAAHGGGASQVSKEELEANKERIVTTLANYKIGIERIKAAIGPTVTLYEIVPEPGVRISRIKNLEDDIALSLAALGIRIIAPIPGKGTIGIEVPNSKPDVVSMRSLIAGERFQESSNDLPIALGKTIANETFIADLAKMPHLLMAGATGQGKSVGLNAILVSLLYKKHPSQIKFVLVDPKKVELTLFNKIERHFLAKLPGEEEAIITDTSKVVATLNSLCIEMDQRYELLKEAQVRNIKEYNAKFIQRRLNPEKGHKYLPYIVLVVDEFADLIMTAGKEVETPIARLAQLARAIGIHLIIATQRPSVNIITGTIKANFPARIAFRVSSKIDSRTILDAGGAEQLIGRGDMLLSQGSDLIRIQCGFVDTPEVAEICDYIGEQRGYPDAFNLPEYVGEESGNDFDDLDPSQRDSMFEDAARLIVTHQQGSTSLIQRKLKLGYNRAGRIVDQLEAAGIVGPFEGSKARQVLISDLASLEQFLNKTSV